MLAVPTTPNFVPTDMRGLVVPVCCGIVSTPMDVLSVPQVQEFSVRVKEAVAHVVKETLSFVRVPVELQCFVGGERCGQCLLPCAGRVVPASTHTDNLGALLFHC